jgi:hypothetical protein
MVRTEIAVWVFSVMACALWIVTFGWSVKRSRREPFYLIVLVLATIFWWLGEALAIRLGKYEYAASFPLMLPGPHTPSDSDILYSGLHRLLGWFSSEAEIGVVGCNPPQQSWAIPAPVVALEAALLFSFVRTTVLRLKNDGASGAFASAGLSALFMINLTAILDPAVSTTQSCGSLATAPSTSHGLHFGLWHWFTDATHPGYWFGVPLVNYVSWFLAVATFSLLLRLDDSGLRGVIRRYDRAFGYLRPIALLIAIFVSLIPVKVFVDKMLVQGQQILFGRDVLPQREWQFTWLAVLLATAFFLLVRYARPHPRARFEGVSSMAQIATFVFCLGLLLFEPYGLLFLVFLVTAVIVIATIFFWPLYHPATRPEKTPGIPA